MLRMKEYFSGNVLQGVAQPKAAELRGMKGSRNSRRWSLRQEEEPRKERATENMHKLLLAHQWYR